MEDQKTRRKIIREWMALGFACAGRLRFARGRRHKLRHRAHATVP